MADQNVPGGFYCHLCKVPCSGIENYQQHIKGAKHLKTQRKESLYGTAPYGTGPPEVAVQDNIPPVTSGIYSCDVCNVAMTGPESFSAHMVGQKHKKKVNQLQMLKNFKGEENGATLEPSPSESACLSEGIQSIPSTSASSSENEVENVKKDAKRIIGPVLENKGNEQMWCNVCQIVISGEKNGSLHVFGKPHLKTMRRENIVVDAAAQNTPKDQPTEDVGQKTPKMDKECQALVQPKPIYEEPAFSETQQQGVMVIPSDGNALQKLRNIYAVEEGKDDQDCFGFNKLLIECNNKVDEEAITEKEVVSDETEEEKAVELSLTEGPSCDDIVDEEDSTAKEDLHCLNEKDVKDVESPMLECKDTGLEKEEKLDDKHKAGLKRKIKGLFKNLGKTDVKEKQGKKKKDGRGDAKDIDFGQNED